MALTDRKKMLYWVKKKKADNKLYDSDHNFEHNRIGYKVLTNNQMYQKEVYRSESMQPTESKDFSVSVPFCMISFRCSALVRANALAVSDCLDHYV